MTLVGRIIKAVVLVSSASSILVACAPQGGMRSYRYDLTKYKAIQEKLHRQLDAENERTKQPAPAQQTPPEEAPEALTGGTLPGAEGSAQPVVSPSEPAVVPEESNPEVQGQNIIETVVNEQIEGKTLSVEALDKLFDGNKAQNAVLGLSASVTVLDGKMDIGFQAVAAPMQNTKEFSGTASPALGKVGIANKILFAPVTGADTDGYVVSTELVGTLLCRDENCQEMIGLLVVEPNLMVIFKVDATGKVEGPFKTFSEAHEELEKSKAATEQKPSEETPSEEPAGEAAPDSNPEAAAPEAEVQEQQPEGAVDPEVADGKSDGQVTTETAAKGTQYSNDDSDLVAQKAASAAAKNVVTTQQKSSKENFYRYNDKIQDKAAEMRTPENDLTAARANTYFVKSGSSSKGSVAAEKAESSLRKSSTKISQADSDLAEQKASLAAVKSTSTQNKTKVTIGGGAR